MGTRETIIHKEDAIHGLPVLQPLLRSALTTGYVTAMNISQKRLKTDHKTSTGASLSDRSSLQQASVYFFVIYLRERWMGG